MQLFVEIPGGRLKRLTNRLDGRYWRVHERNETSGRRMQRYPDPVKQRRKLRLLLKAVAESTEDVEQVLTLR